MWKEVNCLYLVMEFSCFICVVLCLVFEDRYVFSGLIVRWLGIYLLVLIRLSVEVFIYFELCVFFW